MITSHYLYNKLLDPAHQRVHVNVPDDHQIAVISRAVTGLKLAATWPVVMAQRNFPMALNGDASRLFIACRQPPCLAAFGTSSGQLVSTNPCVGDADDLYFDARTKNIYVIGGEGLVDVFKASDGSATLNNIQSIVTSRRARTGLFFPELKLLAVAVPHTTNQVASVLLFETQP